MKNIWFIVVSVLLVVSAAPSAFAGSKKKKATSAQYQAPVIANVTGNTITVSEEKTARTFVISQFTEINVNGQRAAVADLKPGMTVSVIIGVDPTRASRINATGVPVDGRQIRSFLVFRLPPFLICFCHARTNKNSLPGILL
jgi:hypothetical protein